MLSFNFLGNYGRLGNQMFQYASLKGISRHKGYDFVIPPKTSFGIKDSLVAQSDDNLYSVFNITCNQGHIQQPILQERMHHFDEALFNGCPDNVDLIGYFQTEKYFKHIEKEIRNDFAFDNNIISECKQYYNLFDKGAGIICLHVRRGDYINLQDFHPCPSLEYYNEALNILPDLPVIIFSDDIEWCNKQELFAQDRFTVSKNNTTKYDICLMSMCNYHVIANSSFSWWGAWLSNSKQVIAPKEWFGPALKDKDTTDVYCEDWIKL